MSFFGGFRADCLASTFLVDSFLESDFFTSFLSTFLTSFLSACFTFFYISTLFELILGVSICILSASLFSGCASKISGGQEKELASYKAKGLYVEEKSIGGAAALGILPGGGSFYTRHYGLGIANLCLWPISILWDPVSGVWGAESINYFRPLWYPVS